MAVGYRFTHTLQLHVFSLDYLPLARDLKMNSLLFYNRCELLYYTGAPPSGSRSIAYRRFTMYMSGTPGTFLTLLRSSLSHVATI